MAHPGYDTTTPGGHGRTGLTRRAYQPMSSRAKLFRDEPSASPISASVGGRSRALGRIGPRAGAELADAAGAHHRSVPTWRLDRHFRAARRAKAHRAFGQ